MWEVTQGVVALMNEGDVGSFGCRNATGGRQEMAMKASRASQGEYCITYEAWGLECLWSQLTYVFVIPLPMVQAADTGRGFESRLYSGAVANRRQTLITSKQRCGTCTCHSTSI